VTHQLIRAITGRRTAQRATIPTIEHSLNARTDISIEEQQLEEYRLY
jgi:hypothetical protein